MELSYGQIYITLQCGPTSGCTELNVISFKVKTHCAFTSRALIPGVLELAKGSDVICESVLHSVKLTLRHRSHLERCDGTSAFACYSARREDRRGMRGNRGRLKTFQPDFHPELLQINVTRAVIFKEKHLKLLVNQPLWSVALSGLNRCAMPFLSSGGSIAPRISPVGRLLTEN